MSKAKEDDSQCIEITSSDSEMGSSHLQVMPVDDVAQADYMVSVDDEFSVKSPSLGSIANG